MELFSYMKWAELNENISQTRAHYAHLKMINNNNNNNNNNVYWLQVGRHPVAVVI